MCKQKLNTKVCIVNDKLPPEFSGLGIRVEEHISFISDKNIVSLVLTDTKQPKIQTNLSKKKPYNVISNLSNTKSDCYGWKKYTSFIKKQYRYITKILAILLLWTDKYDVVHAFAMSWPSVYSIIFGSYLGKKTVLELTLLGSDDPVSILQRSTFRILGRLKVYALKRADTVICISPALKQRCLDYGIKNEKVKVVPNPVDTDKFHPVERRRKKAIKHDLNICTDSTVILFVGALIDRKGVDIAINSFLQVSDNCDDVCLVLVGPDDNMEEERKNKKNILKKRKERGLNNRIHIEGYVENVDLYMKASDILVAPSRREGFGTVLIEAMASGLPVITLYQKGISDYIISNWQDGIYIKKESPRTFSQSIKALIDRDDLYRRISVNARSKVESKFSKKKVYSQYLNVYSTKT